MKDLELGKCENGASMIEYALIAVLIAIVCVLAVSSVGGSTSQRFSTIGSMANGN